MKKALKEEKRKPERRKENRRKSDRHRDSVDIKLSHFSNREIYVNYTASMKGINLKRKRAGLDLIRVRTFDEWLGEAPEKDTESKKLFSNPN